MPTVVTDYYVQASVEPGASFANCSYTTDYAGKVPAPSPLTVPQGQGYCTITLGQQSNVQLVGAVFKTVSNPTCLDANNFTPASGQTVFVVMPTSAPVTKGVVLLFANAGVVTTLYPSSDPQITNDPE
ncbi:hypothetical protein [Paucibacter soli]|uniref:hypothetical protein n=1 Tax=Paucibacter soli TaxID=3133433 RepID=UPI0030AB125E